MSQIKAKHTELERGVQDDNQRLQAQKEAEMSQARMSMMMDEMKAHFERMTAEHQNEVKLTIQKEVASALE